MGKETKKKQTDGNSKHNVIECSSSNSGGHEEDPTDLISMAQELKEEGNKFFQRRDYRGAMLNYEKAIKLLPKHHDELPNIRANMASCYMQLGVSEYPKAIYECNLALDVIPSYSKALLKRARCYEALNRLDLAFIDVCMVLKTEPSNLMALEISERVKKSLENKGLRVNDTAIELPPDYVEPPSASPALQVVDGKTRKKKKGKKDVGNCEEKNMDRRKGDMFEEKGEDNIIDKKPRNKIKGKRVDEKTEEQKSLDKVVVEEKIYDKNVEETLLVKHFEEPKKTVKLIYGEDIRWAKLPLNFTLLQLREVIHEQFASLRAVNVKYRDQEGDLVTITRDEELRSAEASANEQVSIKFYVVKVSPEQDPFFGRFVEIKKLKMATNIGKSNAILKGVCNIEDWMIEFAQLFKNHVRFGSETCLNLHDLGMKVITEAMEETVTSEEAQNLFDIAAEKFQEMAALSLLNLGNVHLSRAIKKVNLPKSVSRGSVVDQMKTAYGWAQIEHIKAREKYEEALRINPDLFEALLALGQQQFEQAKLSWYYALVSHVDLETWPYIDILQLYENAKAYMEKSMTLSEASRTKGVKSHATNMRSLINLLLGTILYERSIMECKLGLSVWQESLDVAIKKFELAGTSPSDFAGMIKKHTLENNALEVLSFQEDEMLQAWNEMNETKDCNSGFQSSQLEPIIQRRVKKYFHLSDA